uniref:Coiled-coil domain-containing protein 39 n=1 Tax=Sinocyclocheilus anshuiensis TaxID=1608454 RepID=A0A671P167_9TELE
MSNTLLAEVGWDAGFAIPVADAGNKLQKKQKEQFNLENKTNNNKDVINALTEHLKNLRRDAMFACVQALCKAGEKETESEVHFRARGLKSTTVFNNNIFKATQKLDDLKSQLNWDQQTLEAWLQESAHKDEDTMAIIKYAKQDESKIRELTLNIEKLTLEANQKRKNLDSEVTETVTAQIALDKTAESFRQAHIERQEMISQWENTIEQMRKRDQEIQQCAMLQAEVNQVIREKNDMLKERKDFMEREIENNKELERNISTAERQAKHLGCTRRQCLHMCLYCTLITFVIKVFCYCLCVQEIDAQLLRQRELMFRKSQEMQGMCDKEKKITAEICATQAAVSNLDSSLSKLDQNLLKQQMIVSNQDFQIQMLERKTLHLQGKVNTEEKEALEKRASDLEEALEEKNRTAATLTTQLKKLQDDIRCVRKDTDKIGTEKRELTTKIHELELFIDNSEKDQKKLRLKKQDSMVEKGLLKLEVQRLRDLLYDRADGVLSLEKSRLQLQTAMKEREEEIHVHREMLAKQIKLTEQERQAFSAAVNERLFKIDKMRKRYEILTVSLAAPEGDEEKSQACFIIRVSYLYFILPIRCTELHHVQGRIRVK